MRRAIPLLLVLSTLGLAACGDDDETTPLTGATGTTGAQGSSPGGEETTAGGFLAASIPDQIEAVTQAVAENPECEDADIAPGSDFQVAVAIDAAGADPDTPLADIVADNC